MAIKVKTIEEMNRENRKHFNRVKIANISIISTLAAINLLKSQEIVRDEATWEGTLLSSIAMDTLGSTCVQVLASAPHAHAIETGQVKKGWTKFSSEPGLEDWVETKLAEVSGDEAKKKFKYFLSREAVLIGESGFPNRGIPGRYPEGLRFMARGYFHALANADTVVNQEISKLN